MSKLQTPKTRSFGSVMGRVWDRLAGRRGHGLQSRKPRRLMIDPLEERQLLSVTPDPVTLLIDTGNATATTGNEAVATNDNGDTVVVWTQTDSVLDPERSAMAGSNVYVSDQNVYAEYLTNQVQQVSLSSLIIANSSAAGVGGRFALIYGDTVTSTLTFSTTTPVGYSSSSDIIGNVKLTYGTSQSVLVTFTESDGGTVSAANIQSALQSLGGELSDVVVKATDSRTFVISYKVDALAYVTSTATLPQIGIDQSAGATSFSQGFLPAVSITLDATPQLIGGYTNALGDIVPLMTVSAKDPNATAASITGAFALESNTYYTAPTVIPDGSISSPNVVTKPLDVSVTSVKTAADPNGLWTFNITFNGTEGLKVKPELVVGKMTTYSGAAISTSNATVDIIKQSSGAFRVTPEETDDPFTIGLDMYDQYDATVAMDRDGDFIITWTNETADGTTDIYAKRFGPVTYVEPTSAEYANAMVVDNNGDGVVDTVVQCVRAVEAPSAIGLVLIDDSTFLVNTMTSNNQVRPSVDMDAAGGFAISWSAGGQYSSYFNNIYVRAFTADGTPVDSEYQVNANTAQRYDYSSVALSDDGYIGVSYTYFTSTQDKSGMHVTVLNNDGTLVFTDSPSGGVINSSIAFDDGNNVIVVWDERDESGYMSVADSSIYGIQYDIAGTVLIPKFRANSGSLDAASKTLWPGTQVLPGVAIDADGDITIVYYGYGVDVSDSTSPALIEAYYAQQMLLPANADIKALVSSSQISNLINGYSSGDVDSAINAILASAQKAAIAAGHSTAVTQAELGRIRDILDDIANLLRGDANAVMYTQIDANKTAGEIAIIVSDAVANSKRDGSNQTLDIVFSSYVTGGSFTVRVHDPYNYDVWADVTLTPVIDEDTKAINIGDTIDAFDAALEAAVAELGTAWPHDDDNVGAGPIYVHWVDSSEIALRAGTYWTVRDDSGNPVDSSQNLVFEITFMGSVHETYVPFELRKNDLTVTADEQQTITFSRAGAYSATIHLGDGTDTATFWYDSTDPTATAEALKNAIMGLAEKDDEKFGDITVTVVAGSGGMEYDVIFDGAYAGADQGAVAGILTEDIVNSTTGVVTKLQVGNVTSTTTMEGGDHKAPTPSIVTVVSSNSGTSQYNVSLDMQSDGTFVVVYTQANEQTNGSSAGSSILVQTFEETTDTAGPIVTGLEQTNGKRILDKDGTITVANNASTVASLVVDFSEDMSCALSVDAQLAAMGLTRATASDDQIENCETLWAKSVLNPKNYEITLNGAVMQNAIASVSYGLNEAYTLGYTSIGTNKYQAILTFDTSALNPGNQGLGVGNYTIAFRHYVAASEANAGQAGLADAIGNSLGLTGYTPGGSDYSFSFSISTGTGADSPNAPAPGQTDTPVNTVTTGANNGAVVASNADGDYVIVWVRYGSGDDTANQGDIVAQRYNGNGAAVGSEFVVCSYTTGNQSNPDVAMDDQGNFVVTWSGIGNDGESGIFARAFNYKGQALGNQFRVSSLVPNTQSDPSIAMSDDGIFVVTWTQFNNVDNLYGVVYGRSYDASLQPLTDAFVVSGIASQTNEYSDVAMSDNGLIVVTWQTYTGGNGGWDIHAQRLNVSGNKVGGEIAANTYLINEQSNAKITADTDGDFVIVWQSYGQDGSSYGVYGRRYNAAGVAQTASEFRVNQSALDIQYQPDVAMDDAGNFSVIWTCYGQDDPITDDYGIYARMYLPDGSDYVDLATGTVVGEFRVNATTRGNQVTPAVTRNADNSDYVVVWSGPDGATTGIYARRLDPPAETIAQTPNTADTTISGINLALTNAVPVITWMASDADGIASVALLVDGAAVSTIYGPYGTRESAAYAGAVGTLSGGLHSYVIQVTDSSGIMTEHTSSFTVTAPTNSGPAISGVNVSLNSAIPVITWAAADTDGIASAKLLVDGVAVSTIYGPYGTKYSALYSGVIGAMSAGEHSYAIRVTDAAGSAVTSEYAGTFTVVGSTNTGPTISGVNVALTAATPVITWAAADTDGIASANLLIDGVAVSTIYGPYGTKYSALYSGVIGAMSAGEHSYTIRATDAAGRAVTSEYAGTFTVAAAATPTPSAGPTISDINVALTAATPVITWAVADSDGIASANLLIDGVVASKVYGPYGTRYSALYSGVIGNLSAGTHTYAIRATDSAGSPVSTVSGSFEVAASAPATTGGLFASAISSASNKTEWLLDLDGLTSTSSEKSQIASAVDAAMTAS